MNIRRFIERLFSRSDSALVDLSARDAAPGNILTIVSVVYSTAQKTFTGPAVYITQAGAPVAPTPTTQAPTTEQQSSSEAQATQDSQSSDDSDSVSSTAAALSTNSAQQSSTPVESTSSVSTSAPSLTMAPSPTQNTQSTALQNVSSHSPSPTATASGMSGGAKAGLAIGLLALFALLGVGAFYLYRRQKAKQEAHERLDDEKMAMTQPDALPRHPEPEPMMMAAASPRSQDAPRLSIRPMTQFDPNLAAGDRRSTTTGGVRPSASTPDAMPAAAAATVAAAARKENTGLRKPGVSAWERPGAERNAANDPANPFGNHAETIDNISRPGTATTADAPVSATNVPTSAPTAARSPSPGINPADFPLPTSVPPSPNSATFGQKGSGHGKGSDGAAAALAGAAENKSPKKPATAQGPVHRVQMDFVPSMEDELEIHTGHLLRIKHEYDDGWALCELMDGSKSGVVPRSCLSKAALQQRPANAPRQGLPTRPGPQARGPQPNGPGAVPRPLTPGGGRNSPVPASPGPGSMVPRPLTPTGRNSPAPYAQQQRPMSPVAGPGRARASSNASPYVAYQPAGRSMSPGPYGAGGLKPTPRPENARRRSKSVSEMADPKASGAVPSPLMPSRKPVGGHKPSGSS